eukprot:366529-Chlamydomonas_euryale.AAC.4
MPADRIAWDTLLCGGWTNGCCGAGTGRMDAVAWGVGRVDVGWGDERDGHCSVGAARVDAVV